MQQKVLSYQQTLEMSQCDMNGEWKPSAILETMQEAAGVHASILGIGRETLVPQGMVWVVTRNEVIMKRYPKHRDTVTIETFPAPNRRWFFPRYFIFRDEQGEEIGCAASLWVLFSIAERKMLSPDGVRELLPDNSDLKPPMGLPATVAEVAAEAEAADYLPVYTDLDYNGHVNNTRYLDWCCNALGIDTLKEMRVTRFAVNYNTEIRPGQPVGTELRRADEQFSFCGFREGQRSFDVGGTLAKR